MIRNVRVHNLTRRVPLASRAHRARTPLSRLLGLMGRQALEAGEALVLEPCSGIHTCFMRFPIDVLFLDRRGRVLKAVPALPPWRTTGLLVKARVVIELPTGTLQASGTREGDFVVVTPMALVRDRAAARPRSAARGGTAAAPPPAGAPPPAA